MAALVPSLNCYHSFPSTFSPTQNRNSNFNSVKLKSNHQYQNSSFCSLYKIPRHCSPIALALEEDSSSEAVQDGEVNNLGVKAALSVLRFYKREISPILPKSCRYVPTCSEYSMEAYKRYGVVKGTILTAWRLCRCNPLGGYGYDPPRWFDEPSPNEEIDDDD
ncbi:hypothetical protein L6164_003359 [Bauhinia variegata]|uniref:Uncharacterized protein n=1 Tax=Bauhinia variegata TaxID=167791 RepID=A0ACB9Q139_BAUVA|nr:hypothetical protein L6164_003359 [Bauhinia variegata]